MTRDRSRGPAGTKPDASSITIEEGPTPPEVQQALGEALERGRRRASALMQAPGMLDAAAFARQLGVSRAALTKLRQSGKVIGIRTEEVDFRYPAWQIDDRTREPYAVLAELLRIFNQQPWALFLYMVQPHDALDHQTGVQALAQGDIETLVDAARGWNSDGYQ